jgi:hypothetical protein
MANDTDRKDFELVISRQLFVTTRHAVYSLASPTAFSYASRPYKNMRSIATKCAFYSDAAIAITIRNHIFESLSSDIDELATGSKFYFLTCAIPKLLCASF